MTGPSLTRRELGRAALLALPLFAIAAAARSQSAWPKLTVSKDPSCGCCTAWAEHVRRAGFPVEIFETAELDAVKKRLGVPADLAACHTAEIDGYVIEGHVPAAAIQTLLRDRPRAAGLAVRGMPAGSPGMEIPGVPPETYDVVLFGPGMRVLYARFNGHQKL